MKRVHANGPNAEYIVIKPRDTTMNKTHPHRHGTHEDNDILSGKQKHHLENEGCNKLSYQAPSSPAHPVFDPIFYGEVGTKVILKSSVYPNKRHVARASILGCNSKKIVGGVELGRQFIEVQVDQPIEECELLVRERENCRTIGDTFTSGLTIAWPSACIERFSG
ncbi:uncharacterized protein [Aegilops tauschii subsp. strangulata]|uniref:uncharacterized protein isoform X4 n=1 Tax=Aegilops tauschii subsp. strangulata TaxID=200361 RepID=UPI003CC8580D